MVGVDEIHFRMLFIVAAVGVLSLLRKPLRHPDKPGSRWFALTIVAVSSWLGGVGLYYFVHSHAGSFALYSLVLFSITACFVGWILIAVEFATGRSPPRVMLVALGTFAVAHLALLVTNFVGVHELFYRSSSFVDAGGGINVRRGPLFWVYTAIIYVIVFLSTVLFVAEWANSSGLRRRQAAILAMTPVFGIGASVIWFAEVLPFPFDPTPVGAMVGVVLLGWALYRAKFVEVVPVASDAVVSEMVDAVVVLDGEDRVVDWNPAAADLFDVADTPAGVAAEEFFGPVPPETLAKFAGARETSSQVSFEVDGRLRHFSVSVSPVETDDARVLGRVVVIREITESKQREARLVKQNEYLDQFAGIVSHDLQGPLMEIHASADAALRTGDVSHVENVLDATERTEQLVDDLLRLARTGRQVEDVERVTLADAAETAWGRVWSTNATLSVESEQVVSADPDRLLQLLENLFRNSVEHGRSPRSPGSAVDGGDGSAASGSDGSAAGEQHDGDGAAGFGTAEELRITLGSLPDGFYVEDDGRGIPADERPRVFERGYTTADDGTGLGLSIVDQIATAHGWTARVTEGADGGARFEVVGVATD